VANCLIAVVTSITEVGNLTRIFGDYAAGRTVLPGLGFFKSYAPFAISVSTPSRIIRTREFSSQGDPADTIFYIQKGKVKITAVSKHGKEADVASLGAADFFGEG
jgi:CRP-like cAMP-binding protein